MIFEGKIIDVPARGWKLCRSPVISDKWRCVAACCVTCVTTTMCPFVASSSPFLSFSLPVLQHQTATGCSWDSCSCFSAPRTERTERWDAVRTCKCNPPPHVRPPRSFLPRPGPLHVEMTVSWIPSAFFLPTSPSCFLLHVSMEIQTRCIFSTSADSSCCEMSVNQVCHVAAWSFAEVKERKMLLAGESDCDHWTQRTQSIELQMKRRY